MMPKSEKQRVGEFLEEWHGQRGCKPPVGLQGVVIPHWSRAWAMPTLATFDSRPIKSFVLKYLMHSIFSVDPFARNQALATVRNDMDPSTTADYHMPAVDFLDMLVKCGVTADLVLFDPPYSPRQIKESYNGIGLKATQGHTQGVRCKRERELVARLQNIGGIVLSFGWNSTGMGKRLGYELIEGLLVNHGAAHNDTICTAERKISARLVRDNARISDPANPKRHDTK